MNGTRVLIIDDEASTCRMLVDLLSNRGLHASSRTDPEAALDALLVDDYDVVVTDLQMQKLSGLDVCRRLKDSYPDIPVIIISGVGNTDAVIEAIRAGAHDFITKPFDVEELKVGIELAVKERALEGEGRRLPIPELARNEITLIGESRAMLELKTVVAGAATRDTHVLITGEAGTEKELVARAIHTASARAKGPFLSINCALFPEPLLERELFGSALAAESSPIKDGLFVAANGGTILLEEIGEITAATQAKLLRAVQERRVLPLGANDEIPFDARIIATTNRDLDGDYTRGRFRADLYYRLNVVGISVPPLRARGSDLFLLAEYFLQNSRAALSKGVRNISREAAEKMVNYPFPGNVRELENVIDLGVAHASSPEISVYGLPDSIRRYRGHGKELLEKSAQELITVAELEERYVAHVLRTLEGNKAKAANVLQMDRKTLYRKLERWGQNDD